MTDYTPEEVLSGLCGLDSYDEDRIYWDELSWALKERFGASRITLRGEPVEVLVVDNETGGEGSYNLQTYVIIKVGDQYFRKTGHYMSHYGDDWDGPFTEVHPVQKMITVFEDK